VLDIWIFGSATFLLLVQYSGQSLRALDEVQPYHHSGRLISHWRLEADRCGVAKFDLDQLRSRMKGGPV
jgi:hypothetical protein